MSGVIAHIRTGLRGKLILIKRLLLLSGVSGCFFALAYTKSAKNSIDMY